MAPNTQRGATAPVTGQAVSPTLTDVAALNAATEVPPTVQPQIVQAAAPETLIATFEVPTGSSDKLPIARCSVALAGALNGLDLYGITFWKDAKTGQVAIKMPGLRGFQDLRPRMVTADLHGVPVQAMDPVGVNVLSALEDGLLAAYHVWNKHGNGKFPGGRVPVTLRD